MEDIFVENLGLFGPFSGDKGDYIDVWMIKIKRCLLFSKIDNIQKPCLSLNSGFLPSV